MPVSAGEQSICWKDAAGSSAPGCHTALPAGAEHSLLSLPVHCRYHPAPKTSGSPSSDVRGHRLLKVLETYQVVLKET